MKTEPAFIDRPMFTEAEAKAVLMLAARSVVPLSNEQFISPRDILDDVATALRDTFLEIANEQFDEVAANAIS